MYQIDYIIDELLQLNNTYQENNWIEYDVERYTLREREN